MSDSRNIFNNASNPYLPSFNNNASSNNLGRRPSHNTFMNRENPATFAQDRYQTKNSNYRPVSRNQFDKSKLSHQSDESMTSNLGLIMNQGDIFPQDLLFLLSDEQKNIQSFKEKIQKQKMKLQNDFSNFKREIQHIIQDLKISLQAELDIVYKVFIQKYANLKSEVQQIRKIRKQVENSYFNEFPSNFNAQNSNKQLVKELEKDSQNYKKYRIQNYIVQLQKKKLNPLLEFSKQIILMGTTTNPYYNADSTVQQLTQLKSNFNHFTKHMFSSIGQYVRSPILLAQKIDAFDDIQSETYKSEYNKRQDDFQIPVKYPKLNVSKEYAQIPKANINNFEFINNNAINKRNQYFQGNNYDDFSLRPTKKVTISQSQQILCSNNIQDINAKYFVTIKPDHSNIILCSVIINGKYIATGSKDCLINIYTFQGYKVATLRGHQASICTLSIVQDTTNTYLASGSDVGCSSVILWDTNNWIAKCKMQAHTAAVTSILDLNDYQTIVSGSYDKKINVYNFKKSSLLYNLPNNKSSVTGIISNGDKSKIMSCGLDNTLYVWNVHRDKLTKVVQTINLDKVIQNNTMICALNSSLLRSEIVIAGTKDGKIKFFNIINGQTQKTLTANNSAIIQLVVIQRLQKPNYPIILSCSCKDKTLVMTKTDTGINSLIDVKDKLNIQFGCGIGPKIIFEKYGTVCVMGIVSQIGENKQFNIFELQMK